MFSHLSFQCICFICFLLFIIASFSSCQTLTFSRIKSVFLRLHNPWTCTEEAQCWCLVLVFTGWHTSSVAQFVHFCVCVNPRISLLISVFVFVFVLKPTISAACAYKWGIKAMNKVFISLSLLFNSLRFQFITMNFVFNPIIVTANLKFCVYYSVAERSGS